MTNAVVLDIEGTTSSLSAVRARLFPYARARIGTWLRSAPAEATPIIADVRALAGRPLADVDEVVRILEGWSDRDVKSVPLKTLQGLIWRDGFAAGELVGHVYDDVPSALACWQAAGVRIYVYSSGSVLAQRLWFRHSDHGDLSGCFAGHFDAADPGPKTDPASYRTITARIGVPPAEILFASDARAELDAARAAGMRTVGVSRDSDGGPDVGDHTVIGGFGGAATRLVGCGHG